MSEEAAGSGTEPTNTQASTTESILTVATEDDSKQGQTESTTTNATDTETGKSKEAASTDGAAKTDAEDGKAKAGAPEKYEITLPEGVTMDDALWAEAEPILREMNASNELAQKLVGLQVKSVQGYQAKIQEAWTQQNQQWLAELKSDPEFGGANFKKNAAYAQSAVAWIGSRVEGFQAALKSLGIGNNPALARGFSELGKALSEDTVPKSGTTKEPEGNMFLPGSKRT